MAEWMSMADVADECAMDVYAVRDALEALGFSRHGRATDLATSHGFAATAAGESGREVTLWHPDTVLIVRGFSLEARGAGVPAGVGVGIGGGRFGGGAGANGGARGFSPTPSARERVQAYEVQSELFVGTPEPPEDNCSDICQVFPAKYVSEGEAKGVDSEARAPEMRSVRADRAPDGGPVKRAETDVRYGSEAGVGVGRGSASMNKPVGKIRPGFDAIIATDGACSGNPGPGGWAWVEQVSGARGSGGAAQTTNNIMELTALIRALEYVGPQADVLLRIDSQYVINSMTKWAPGWRCKGWKKADGKPVANRELIERLLDLYEGRTGRTEVEWVKGHNGDAANELVDSLAVAEAKRFA